MQDQREAWDSFYGSNVRPWRGVSDIGEAPFPEGARVLEIGCGNGKTAIALKESGFKVTAMDFSQAAIDSCSDIKGVEFVCASVTEMPFPDDSFDGALTFHVLEHLTADELRTAVSEIGRVLRPGSYLSVRVFSADDMRSEKGTRLDDSTVVRGNGIMYHYFTEEELREAFDCMDVVHIGTYAQNTRFGTVRSRIHAVFRTH